MKKLLTDAVAIGNAYARANTVYPRDQGQRIYPETDSEWVMAFADKDTYFLKDGARRVDCRLWMHYNAVCVTPAMALTKPGAGSDYDIVGLDSKRSARRRRDLQAPSAAQFPRQGQLVGDDLRPPDPQHAADRPAVRRAQQPQRQGEGEQGWVLRHLSPRMLPREWKTTGSRPFPARAGSSSSVPTVPRALDRQDWRPGEMSLVK